MGRRRITAGVARAALVGVSLLAAGGCGGDDEPMGSAPEIWCEALCTAQRRCGDRRSAGDCVGECLRVRPSLTTINVSGATALSPCIEDLSCSAFLDEPSWDAEMEVCWTEARLSNPPTPAVRSFCGDYTLALFECNVWLSVERCEQNFGMWTEELTRSVLSCAREGPCDQVLPCIEFVFGGA